MKIAIMFPNHSEALFDKNSSRTFGGASVQMYLIAKELSEYKRINTYSFIPEYNLIDFDDNEKFDIVNIFKESDPLLVKITKFNSRVHRIKPDVIIQHGLTFFSCLLAVYCKLSKIKFVYMFASDKEVQGKYQNNGKKCILFNLLVKKSSILISQNLFQHDLLLKKYNKRSYLIYNGFNIDKNVVEEKRFILWVGRCDTIKKPELFLELAKKNPNESFLMIAPETLDKEYYSSIKTNAKKIENLRFISFVPFSEIDSFFKHAKVLINSSEYEGFPQTFIQAFKAGTPVISLNVNPDKILSKYNCGICANGDFNKMAKLLENLIIDANLLNLMSQNAYNYAKENHDIKLNVKNLLKLIFPDLNSKYLEDKDKDKIL
ncbi:hypothetical protein Mpsy_2515 [Methanolobus psychrophilus R15]|nr:hypothetical protein Mpsy_2515 [Methanolobus psychrophilus R15]